jgi:hypothetical protein
VGTELTAAMIREWREETAAKANAAGSASRNPGAPVLSADSTAEQLAAWLQWNDPNGSHTADLAEREGFDPYDVETAWEVLAQAIDEEAMIAERAEADRIAAARRASR